MSKRKLKTGISRSVQLALKHAGKQQTELANQLGYTPQAMSNKITAGSWTASDLARVADFIGGRLVLICNDGTELSIKPDKGPFHKKRHEETDEAGEKHNKTKPDKKTTKATKAMKDENGKSGTMKQKTPEKNKSEINNSDAFEQIGMDLDMLADACGTEKTIINNDGNSQYFFGQECKKTTPGT